MQRVFVENKFDVDIRSASDAMQAGDERRGVPPQPHVSTATLTAHLTLLLDVSWCIQVPGGCDAANPLHGLVETSDLFLGLLQAGQEGLGLPEQGQVLLPHLETGGDREWSRVRRGGAFPTASMFRSSPTSFRLNSLYSCASLNNYIRYNGFHGTLMHYVKVSLDRQGSRLSLTEDN